MNFEEEIGTFESKVGYKLIQEIGRGAFAKVYLAIREGFGLDRYVAVKLVDMSAMGERQRTVIMDEARITGKLSHANIIHIYDCGTLGDHCFFIVAELINGFSLKDVIRRHTDLVMDKMKGQESIPMSLLKHSIASILMHTALGLDYIHNARDLVTGDNLQVIHNDLKPGNILLGFDGSLKVSDFGISYSPLRAVKLKGGSPAYMAPEWIKALIEEDKAASPSATSDIFSLGVTLHETLTDRRLFKATRPDMNRKQMLKAIYEQMENYRRGRTRKINPAADPNLCRIADKCLAFEPEKRYQNTKQIIDELDELISDGVYHPQILDRRFLAEYMQNLFTEEERIRYRNSVI